MCGIAGIVRFDGAPVERAKLDAMVDLLAHRGPDGRGVWVDGSVGFGHSRLSIIDVEGSPQPMASAGGAMHLTFNGEILNYRELRAGCRYPFRTSGDTETLLAVHAEHGSVAPTMLRGQFAYALHDRDRREVVLVRDHLGILPLHWYATDRFLAFASEVKALVPALDEPLAVDERSLADYLLRRAVPAPHTLFRSVHKVRPGHRLRVALAGGIREERYWRIPTAAATTDGHDAVARVDAALRTSIARNLVADVPVGSYSSGGLDSSLVVALATEARDGEPVDTFSAGFDDARFDELPYARVVSDALKTRHHEVHVTADDFASSWERLSWHRDAPLSEPADVAVHLLAASAREHVKVVLSGEGSDELFAGYPKYRYAPFLAPLTAVPGGVRAPTLDLVQRALPARAGRVRTMVRALGAPSSSDVIERWFAPFTDREQHDLLPGADPYGQPDVVAGASGDLVRRMLEIDCHAWLSDNLLERGDRMSMAASVELRPPFLDVDLVELAFSLPTDVKVKREGRRLTGKWVVREIARRHLPAGIVDRPKVGFRVPLDAWFRTGLRDLARDVLGGTDSFVAEVFDRDELRALLDAHQRGRRNEEIRIWTLVSLEMWHRAVFDR